VNPVARGVPLGSRSPRKQGPYCAPLHNPALFAAAFAAWVRESWPEKAGLVAIDGKTSRRSHDRSTGTAPLHLVSAFATTARLVLAQEAVPDKASELAAIPPLLERLGAGDGLKGALVSIDAIATNAEIARAIADQGADWLLAVKANQPSLRAEVEAAFAEAGDRVEAHADLDKGHGRIEERRMAVLRETDWLEGTRRFPGELRLPGTTCLLKAETRVERAGPSGARPATSSLPAPSPPPKPPSRCASTGRSRTACTGCSTSPSPKTSPACARATAPETWPPSATSPSTSFAPPRRSDQSSPGGRSQDGTPTTSMPSSHLSQPNLDSEP
jgi:predicted transposase YbfD/YdcC